MIDIVPWTWGASVDAEFWHGRIAMARGYKIGRWWEDEVSLGSASVHDDGVVVGPEERGVAASSIEDKLGKNNKIG
jgi:hypothetical protein